MPHLPWVGGTATVQSHGLRTGELADNTQMILHVLTDSSEFMNHLDTVWRYIISCPDTTTHQYLRRV